MANLSVNLDPTLKTSLNINEQPTLSINYTETKNIESSLSKNIEQKASISPVNNLNGAITTKNSLSSNFNSERAAGYGYVHIKYSHKKPTTDEELLAYPDEETWYMGIYSDSYPSGSTDYTRYTWFQIRGNDGEVGTPGEKGEQGEKGDSGETTLIVINPLYFSGILSEDAWTTETLNNVVFYRQIVDVTDLTLLSSTMTQQELIEYMNIKMTDRVTPLIDLIVSNENIELGRKQIEQWSYLSRVYITTLTVDDEIKYYVYFECYKDKPTIQLMYQLKVI